MPLFESKHWFFRVWAYGKIQIFFILLFTALLGLIFIEPKDTWFYVILAIDVLVLVYHAYHLIEFTPAYYWFHKKEPIKGQLTKQISVLSCNVYQYNNSTQKFVDLIKKKNPDIFITYESNQKWEDAINVLSNQYEHNIKIAQDNTYGMHLFSKIPFEFEAVHTFVSKDIPSIEIEIKIDNEKLRLFAVHPPPPSPTEEETSIERDGELMAVAKYLEEKPRKNVIVIGDFNNVAWSKSSMRFRRISGLLDPRVGRGLIPTFHAKIALIRVPIDLLFHSPTIVIDTIETTEPIDSDHFPLYFTFSISTQEEIEQQEHEEAGDRKQMEEDIAEAKEEDGDR